ncbi:MULTISPECIES: isocitrate lyase/PEP mutase family protein [Microbacterium]|uniref:isocitrate lyase/PEP mutase family protein n=1 Tax=Microbacterium TaxID=33882 RepID=UPI0010F43A4A|nr:isocitrate lyase/phosphoenolpyruvate mutase family protein [Microbacterium sp. 4NA327F11]MCK9916995.1 isocitrate lyase/phosphoenolpyruvate mutase family protein [Microbacteriaceae bacterium K1510]
MSIVEKGAALRALHTDPPLLTLVNVWDVASARVVAAHPRTHAIATASHAIAAAFGYDDGERIPLELHLATVERIVASTTLPVTADLEAGYGDPAATVRRAIDVGVVGANLEDELRPLAAASAAVAAAVEAADAAGVPFSLNARTDAFLRAEGRGRAESLADAITRGRAYLAEGATCVFVPGVLDEPEVRELVAAFGPGRLSVLAAPGSLPLPVLAALGVARVSFGPWPQRAALTALDRLVDEVADDGLPVGIRPLV